MAEINPPVFVQGGSHGAAGIRRLFQALYISGSNGFFESNALAVSQSASPGMSVQISTGRALITGSESVGSQGAYFVDNQGSTTVSLAPSSGSNPRHDLIIARVRDAQYSGSDNAWSLEAVQGTPSGSPTDPSLASFNNYLILARVVVGTSVTEITNANITDRRLTAGQSMLRTRGSVLTGLSGSKPVAPDVGQVFYETDTNLVKIYNGSAWVDPLEVSRVKTASVHRNSNLSVPNATNTVITWTTENHDVGDLVNLGANNDRIQIPDAGYWHVDVGMGMPGGGGGRQILDVAYGASSIVFMRVENPRPTGGEPLIQSVSRTFYFDAPTYIRAFAFQSSGSARNIEPQWPGSGSVVASPFMSVHRVG